MKATKTRAEFVTEALGIRSEIKQLFEDTNHWNTTVRKPDEARVNPDPDGGLRRLVDGIEQGIRGELFSLYIVGSNEHHAAPTLAEADCRLRELTAFHNRGSGDDAKFEARIEGWPGTREEYDKDVQKWAGLPPAA